MKRVKVDPRPDWREKVVAQGLSFPVTLAESGEVPYWCDDTAYEFTLSEIETLENATDRLWQMCLQVVEDVISSGTVIEFGLDNRFFELIKRSWQDHQMSMYGRFDFAWDGVGPVKLLEFNGDTPTGLIESSVIQWHWLMDQKPDCDQLNSVHERLVRGWKAYGSRIGSRPVHFASIFDGEQGEDFVTTEYMRDTAIEAGLITKNIQMNDIGFDVVSRKFVDLDDVPIETCFKLYPWEDMLDEDFSKYLLESYDSTVWMEPLWKVLLSNKAMLAWLWRLFPGDELLLPASLDGPLNMEFYAQKFIHGREGDGVILKTPEGLFGSEPSRKPNQQDGALYCWQEYVPLPNFDGYHPVLGSWVVQGHAAGLNVRESKGPITDFYSRFIPHYISDAPMPSDDQCASWIEEDFV